MAFYGPEPCSASPSSSSSGSAVVWLIVMLVRRTGLATAGAAAGRAARPPALDVLEERYARGEITHEEFVERRTVLLGGRPSPPSGGSATGGSTRRHHRLLRPRPRHRPLTLPDPGSIAASASPWCDGPPPPTPASDPPGSRAASVSPLPAPRRRSTRSSVRSATNARRTLTFLGAQPPEAFDAPAVPGWRVREVVAHLITLDRAAVTRRDAPPDPRPRHRPDRTLERPRRPFVGRADPVPSSSTAWSAGDGGSNARCA